MMGLMKKRVYDISAVTDKTIKVKFNGDLVPTKNFSQYIDLYIGDKTVSPRVYEHCSKNERWEYAVAISPNAEFTQISFVNGISTHMGGTHVNYIITQITSKLKKYIENKKKKIVKASSIKEQLILFLRCDILFPSFNSQSKDFLNNADFGSSCVVSDAFIEMEKLRKLFEASKCDSASPDPGKVMMSKTTKSYVNISIS
jgi:DNA topoisomerase-2